MPCRPKPSSVARPRLSDIGRLGSDCPYCERALPKRPERKTACPYCGEWIYVRSRPLDRARVLLTGQQASQVEAEWTQFQLWAKRTNPGQER